MKLISIVVPVFNEEENLLACYERLDKVCGEIKDYEFEFIFTDNNSSDTTFEILRELSAKDPRLRAFRFSRNFGYQRSIWTGYKMSRGQAAVELDCDLQDPPEMIRDFIYHWERGSKIVYGIRKTREEGALINAARKIYYRALNLLSDIDLPLDAGDFMLIDKQIIELLGEVKDPNIYVRGSIFSFGYPRTGIPYDRASRKYGESKFPLMKLAGLATDGIVSRSTIPLRLAFFLGIFILFFTVMLGLYFFLTWFIAGDSLPSGFTTLVLLVLFSISLNSLLLGIFGEYLARIYTHSSLKHMTIIEDSLNE